MWTWVIGIVLIAHGIGHSMGILGMFKVADINPAWHGESWLLTNIVGDALTQAVGATLWSIAMLGFIVLGLVVFGWLPATWWQPLAIVASVTSLLGVVFFPAAFPTVSTIAAVAIDLAVLYTVWTGWVPTDLPV